MRFILIRVNQVYYVKDMETLKQYNTTNVVDLRKVRDLLNKYYESGLDYDTREKQVLDLLGCPQKEDGE